MWSLRGAVLLLSACLSCSGPLRRLDDPDGGDDDPPEGTLSADGDSDEELLPDCDEIQDPVPLCPALITEPVELLSFSGDAYGHLIIPNVQLHWTGVEYTLIWRILDTSGVFLSRLGPDGAPVEEIRFSDYSRGSSVWNGRGYGHAIIPSEDPRDRQLFFRITDDRGNPVGPEALLSVDALASQDPFAWGPRVLWTGSEHVLLWQEDVAGGRELFFATFDGDGLRLSDNVQLTAYGQEPQPSSMMTLHAVTAGPGIVTAAWVLFNEEGDYDTAFALLGLDGTMLAEPYLLPSGNPTNAVYSKPTAAWTGCEFGVFWAEVLPWGSLRYQPIGPDGAPRAELVELPPPARGNADWVSTLWLGQSFGLLYSGPLRPIPTVYFQRLDRRGSPLGDLLEIEAGDEGSNPRWYTQLAWTGDELGALWMMEHDDGRVSVHFVRIGIDC